MKLCAGFSVSSRVRNFSSTVRRPSTSMNTPCGELLTQPSRRSSVASRNTNGRNPTPCTAPRMASFKRMRWLVGPEDSFTRGVLSEPFLSLKPKRRGDRNSHFGAERRRVIPTSRSRSANAKALSRTRGVAAGAPHTEAFQSENCWQLRVGDSQLKDGASPHRGISPATTKARTSSSRYGL